MSSINENVIVSGLDSIVLPTAKANGLEYLKVFGKCTLEGTPSPEEPASLVCTNGSLTIDSQGNVIADGTATKLTDSLGNNATTEILCSLASYKDEQDILSGTVNRKIEITVLDGTENWERYRNWYRCNIFADAGEYSGILCTHFTTGTPTDNKNIFRSYQSSYVELNYGEMLTVEDLKAWLASQYENGTPVIILSTRENSVIESVTGQNLTTQQGSNTISIAESSQTNITLEASYETYIPKETKSFTGEIDTKGVFEKVEDVANFQFTEDNKYTMQISKEAYLKIDKAVFYIHNEKFNYKATADTLYIKTIEPCRLVVLAN